jgi:pimeloyl-ACP methyl ester carboxylesterase
MRIILFDKRGVGLSDRIEGAPTLETTIEDAKCVLDTVGSKQSFIMGTSEGGAAAVLLAATYPDRILGLILYAAFPKFIRANNDPEWADTEEQFERKLDQMQKMWGGPWAIESFAPSRAGDESFRNWWATVLRSASSPSSVKAVLNLLREIDIRPLLPQIPIKTLVVHKTDDRIVSVEAGRYFATHMPNVTWLELLGNDHLYFVQNDALLAALIQFCQEATPNHLIDTWIATILYAVTNKTQRSSSDLQSHITAYDPRHMSSEPKGVLALFDSPTRAIQCALDLQEKTKYPMAKISLHVGACRVINGKPLELALTVAEQVAELAAPGGILVTGTLHDILAGSGFVFKERNELPNYILPQNISLWTLVES